MTHHQPPSYVEPPELPSPMPERIKENRTCSTGGFWGCWESGAPQGAVSIHYVEYCAVFQQVAVLSLGERCRFLTPANTLDGLVSGLGLGEGQHLDFT